MSKEFSAHTAAIDKAHIDSILKRIRYKLSSAHISVNEERETVESLATQQALPPYYRQAYGQIADSLLQIEKMIEATKNVVNEITIALYDERIRHRVIEDVMPVLPETIHAARQTIDQINAAEVRLVNHCESEKATLLAHDKSGLVDWSNGTEYDFSMLLDPGPERAFYETCCAGDEPLWISLGDYSPEDSKIYNWNTFEHDANHPLQSDHHGWLVYRIIDLVNIPWELIPRIKEIRVDLEFTACETVWERSPAPLPEVNGK